MVVSRAMLLAKQVKTTRPEHSAMSCSRLPRSSASDRDGVSIIAFVESQIIASTPSSPSAASFGVSGGAPTTASGSSFQSPVCRRSEEHTSELQSLMRISYAVFCLKTTKNYSSIHRHSHKLNQAY